MSEVGRLLNRANENILLLLEKKEAQLWESCLERVQQLRGVGSLLKRIARAGDREQLCDYLAEIRYSLLFVGLGFEVQIDPSGVVGKKVPDLRISRDGRSALVEVKHFRELDPGPRYVSLSSKEFLDETFLLEPYGEPERDVKKIRSQAKGKFGQVGSNESIIAFWNEEEEEIDTESAVSWLREDVAKRKLALPHGLLFVLYGSSWERPRQQFYCFPLQILSKPQSEWMQELESAQLTNSMSVRRRAE